MSSKKDIGELLKQDELITEAIRKGAYQAMKQYILAGESMVAWPDGKIVYIPPAELQKMLDAEN